MKIAMTGVSGFVGRRAAEHLRGEGHTIQAISMRGTPKSTDLEGCDAVVHLAGEPVAQRWTPQVRERIRTSRVEGTRAMVAAMAGMTKPPQVLINASAVGYYGSRGEEILTESSPPGTDFLAGISVEWEREALEARKLGTRVVMLRIAMVLGPHGGALEKMAIPFRLGLGGPIAGGQYWMSWIDLEDLVRLIDYGLTSLDGPVNASAPDPIRNTDFTRELARAVHRPAIFPVPKFALKLLYGEMAKVVYASQRAIPEAATRAGFTFSVPDVGTSLRRALA